MEIFSNPSKLISFFFFFQINFLWEFLFLNFSHFYFANLYSWLLFLVFVAIYPFLLFQLRYSWFTLLYLLWDTTEWFSIHMEWSEVKWSDSCSVVSDSLWPHGLYSPWNSPGQNIGVSSLSLLQGIFPTQGSNPGLPHCGWILYQLSSWNIYHLKIFQNHGSISLCCIIYPIIFITLYIVIFIS